MLEQHRTVEQFDVDPAILHSFDRIGDLDQFTGRGFRVGIGTGGSEFNRADRIIAMIPGPTAKWLATPGRCRI